MAQLEGGLIFGLTAALYGEITIEKGRVQQSNFHDYRMLRIDQTPKIEVHVVKSGEPPGGIGETGINAGPPALRNAIYAATGVALRRLPIDRARSRWGRRHERQRAASSLSVIVDRHRRGRHRGSGSSAAPVRWPLPADRRCALADYRGGQSDRRPGRARQSRAWWSAANIWRARRTAWSATPRRAARNLPAASASNCRSARSIRPTSRRTRKPASAITATRISCNAVHRGIRRDGARLYPAMPYTSYTYMTDDDALAIKAYLFSLPPVRAAPPPNTLTFPFNQRWAMVFWSALFNPDTRFEPDTSKSPEWNRGAYLAEALAHCGECHTPRNLAFALDNREKFAGAVTAGWRAFNITSDKATGIGGWRDDDLVAYLSTGHAAGPRHGVGADGRSGRPQPQPARAGRHPRDRRLSAQRAADRLARSAGDPGAAGAGLAQGRGGTPDARGKMVFEGACVELPRLDRREPDLADGDADRRMGGERSRRDQRRPDRDLRHQAADAGGRALDARLRQRLHRRRDRGGRQLRHRAFRRQRLETDREGRGRKLRQQASQ